MFTFVSQYDVVTHAEENGIENETKRPRNGENGIIVHELGRSIVFLVPFLTLFRSPYRSTWVVSNVADEDGGESPKRIRTNESMVD